MAILEQKQIYDDSKKAFTQLEKDLETINKEVITLTKSSNELAKALALVKKSNDGTEARKLAEGTDKLTKSTKKLKVELTAQERVEKQIIAANKKLADSHTKQAKDLALLKQRTLQQNKALREQAKATLGVKKGISSLTKQLFAGFGIIAGMQALGRVFTDALKTFTKFEKTNSKLAAVLSKTKEEIKSLSDQQKDLGSTTAFTASQVGELQIELAKLGFSLREIEASTPGILALAAATGTELAAAAELAGATLRIFNLDASEMQRVTDVLALSTTKSSLTMEKLATILPTVGKTAEIAGLSLEQTAALAGTLTDRGLEASVAGTSLRNIFLKLAKDGRSWDGAMKEINSSTDKLKTATEVFGVRASTAGIILSETAESTDELTTALNDANGAAQEMADTMLNNLSGDVTKATSAWEGFILSVESGEGIISRVMRASTQAFTNFLGVLTDLNNGMTLFEIRAKKTSALTEGLEKDTKGWTESLKGLTTQEEKENFIATQSIRIKQKLRGANFTLSKLQKEISNNTLNIFSKEFREREKLEKQTKFNIIAYKEQIKILNTLVPIEKENNVAIEAGTEDLKNNNKEIEKQNKNLQKEIDLRLKRNIAALDRAEVSDDSDLQDQIDLDQAKLEQEQEFQDKKAEIQDVAANEKRLKDEDEAAAWLLVREQAETSAVQLAKDIFNNFQDEKLAEINSNAEAEKKILQQRLDDGLISEEQFANQVQAIEKKQRIASAKAEKKKAIFDIAIGTAVAAIKALPNFIASAAILIAGGIAAIAVAAKPIPKFAEGEVNIQGQSHSKGGIHAEIEGGESVINKGATSQSEGLLNMINDGLITDKNVGNLSKQDNNMLMAGLLMQGNKHSQDLITLMSNMGWTYEKRGEMIINKADGSFIEKFNING